MGDHTSVFERIVRESAAGLGDNIVAGAHAVELGEFHALHRCHVLFSPAITPELLGNILELRVDSGAVGKFSLEPGAVCSNVNFINGKLPSSDRANWARALTSGIVGASVVVEQSVKRDIAGVNL